LRGDNIDTDRIMPARFLRCVTFDGIEAHVFEDDRQSATAPHPFDEARFQGAAVLLVNRNFGSGSSREHAPQGLIRWGIRGLVGESFAEIFLGNCVALGAPCMTLASEDLKELQALVDSDPKAELTLELKERRVVFKPSSGKAATPKAYSASLPEGARAAFLRGTWDAAGVLLENPGAIGAVAEKLPYVRGFEGVGGLRG
jgi:3-isopropylmalate/(R)-2-methylmalate dehydratase small subunit